ncbi:MAG: transglycosylase SLT domain-containing protein [Erythrobacter sp.]
MNDNPLGPAPIRSSYEQAVRTHEATRLPGAVRQIATPQRTQSVEQAIASAAHATTIDFDFLVAQAQVESAMDPDARARTSSATGLYQFIESTWIGTMQRHGERFGLSEVAAQIDVTASGHAYVGDPQAREAILALRNDPQIAALMAAGLAEDNRAHLAPILGRQPDHSELYLAHFLGAGGAGRFLSAMADDPGQPAAALFRRPAAANRPVFFEGDGRPRSLSGVMDYLSGKLERARASAPVPSNNGYSAATLAPPPGAAPPPYIIASEDVFGPMNPPTLTGHSRPTISGAPPIALATTGTRESMSNVLRATFGDAGQTGSPEQVHRAYHRLEALGL